jgi:hypothetical protein
LEAENSVGISSPIRAIELSFNIFSAFVNISSNFAASGSVTARAASRGPTFEDKDICSSSSEFNRRVEQELSSIAQKHIPAALNDQPIRRPIAGLRHSHARRSKIKQGLPDANQRFSSA